MALLVLGLIVILIIGFGVFYFKERAVYQSILVEVNEIIPGEIIIKNIHPAPFKYWPYLAIRLDGVLVYLNKEENRHSDEKPVMDLEHVYLGVKYQNLYDGVYKFGSMYGENGDINLKILEDTTLNIETALGISRKQLGKSKNPDAWTGRENDPWRELELFEVYDVHLTVDNSLSGQNNDIFIETLINNYTQTGTIVNTETKGIVTINGIFIEDKPILKNKKLDLDLKYGWETDSLNGAFKDSRIKLGGLEMDLSGRFNFDENPWVKLEFGIQKDKVKPIDLSDIDSYLDEAPDGKGFIKLKGKIHGNTFEGLQLVQFDFETKNVSLIYPETGETIENITVKGNFYSGGKHDFSDVQINLRQLHAEIDEEFVDGNLSIQNLSNPSIKFQLDSKLKLDGLEKVLNIQKMKRLSGFAEIHADVDGFVNFDQDEILENAGSINIELKDVSLDIPDVFLNLEKVNGKIIFENNNLTLGKMSILSGQNDLTISGNLRNLLYKNTDSTKTINGELNLISEELSINYFFRHDSILFNAYDEIINNLNANVHFSVNSKDLKELRRIPKGSFVIDNFSATLANRADINNLKGIFYVTEDTLGISKLTGKLGSSDFILNTSIRNYTGLSDSKETIPLTFFIDIQSASMLSNDFFQYKDRFYLPQRFENESLKDFRFTGSYDINNIAFFDKNPLPESRLKIQKLNWTNLSNNLSYKNFSIDIERRDMDLEIHKFKGNVGSTDINFTATLENFNYFEDPDMPDLNGNFVLKSKNLDFNELLNLKIVDKRKNKIEKYEDYNPFDQQFYNLNFSTEIDKLLYKNFIFYDIKGQIISINSQKIDLKNLSFSTSGGDIKLNGILNANDPNSIIVDSNIEFKNIDLDRIAIDFQYNEENLQPKNHFKGIFSAAIDSRFVSDQDLNIDLASTNASIDFLFQKGRIEDFEPAKSLAKFFGNRDLENIRFGEIKNVIEFENGLITIPRMDISSTLGQIYVSGVHNLNSEINYIVEVPFKLVSSAGWTALTGRKRKEDAAEDDIIQAGNGIYISLRLQGNDQEGVKVKLGRGKDARKEARANNK